LNQNKQKTRPSSFKESIYGCFSENLGLFRFVTKQFCLFRLFRYRFKTPKQTKIFNFWFHKTNRNKRETDLVSVCFGSNQVYFCLFRGHPTGALYSASSYNNWQLGTQLRTQLQLHLLFYIVQGLTRHNEKFWISCQRQSALFLIIIFHFSIGKSAMNAPG
jgi:hypothetical protein